MNRLNTNSGLANQTLMDVLDYATTANSNRAISSAGLAIGTTSTAAVKIVNTVTYLNAGVFASKATAEVAFTAGAHDIAASATSVQEQCYLVCLAANGTASLVAGGIATGVGKALLPEPGAYAGLTPIGYVRIAVAAGSTNFAGATTALSSGALTVSYVNLGYLAPRFDTLQ